MFNESFINSCFVLCFNKYSQIKKTKKLYLELDTLIKEFGRIHKDKMPMDVGNKMSLLETMVEQSIKGLTVDQILSVINWKGKFEGLSDFVDHNINVIVDQDYLDKVNNDISVSRESILIMNEKAILENILAKYNSCDFETYSEINESIFDAVGDFNNKIQETKRAKILNSGGSFSLGEEDIDETNLDNVLNMLVEVNDPSNKIPTGYNLIDNDILNGGFAKKAVYVFAGAAKSGKSTFINNILFNAAQSEYEGKRKLFIYISLENLPHEALQRSACKVLGVNPEAIYKKAKDSRDNFKKDLNEYVLRYKNAISFDYKASQSITVSDLYPYIDSKIEEYNEKLGDVELGGIYIDYLNHLKGIGKKDLRLQLGDLIQALKTLAIDYDVPVITATQLNRESLRVKNSRELHIGMVAESHVISANSDGVFLLARDLEDDNLVHFNSGVQRGGKSQRAIDFKVDFDKLSFLTSVEPGFKNQPDIECCNMSNPAGTTITGFSNEPVKTTPSSSPNTINFDGMGDSF